MSFVLDMIAGTITGVITGFGIGGGTLLIIYLTMFRGISQIAAQGINLLYFIPSAGCALVSHIKNRRVVWRVAIFSAIAGAASTIAASTIAGMIDTIILRRIFGVFLLVVGITELLGTKKGCKK